MARATIEEALARRTLTLSQKQLVISSLGNFSGQLASLWYFAGDKEAETFAFELTEALHEAKWTMFVPASKINLAPTDVPFSGAASRLPVGITVLTRNEAKYGVADALVKELIALGFDANVDMLPAQKYALG